MTWNKNILVVLLLLLAVAIAVPAFAQPDTTPAAPQAAVTIAPDKAQEIAALRKQILDLKQQLIDKYLEAGVITTEQAQTAKDRLQRCRQNLEQNPNLVPGFIRQGKGRFCAQGKGLNGQYGCQGNCPWGRGFQSSSAVQ
ncbi:MAG: DUF2680 domain-containing protein [Bacillota bacterium]